MYDVLAQNCNTTFQYLKHIFAFTFFDSIHNYVHAKYLKESLRQDF